MKVKLYTVYSENDIQYILKNGKIVSDINKPNVATLSSRMGIIGCQNGETPIKDTALFSTLEEYSWVIYFIKDSNEIFLETDDMDEYLSTKYSPEEVDKIIDKSKKNNTLISFDEIHLDITSQKIQVSPDLYGTCVKNIRRDEIYKIYRYYTNEEFYRSKPELIYSKINEDMLSFKDYLISNMAKENIIKSNKIV